MKSNLWKSLPDNIQWGLIWGASSAGFFSIINFVIWLFLGFPFGVVKFSPPEWDGATVQMSVWSITAAYWVAGLAGGAIVGLFRPFAKRSYWTASLVGILAGYVIVFPLIVALFGLSGWTTEVWASGIFLPLLFGPFYAGLIRWRYSGKLQKKDDGGWQMDS